MQAYRRYASPDGWAQAFVVIYLATGPLFLLGAVAVFIRIGPLDGLVALLINLGWAGTCLGGVWVGLEGRVVVVNPLWFRIFDAEQITHIRLGTHPLLRFTWLGTDDGREQIVVALSGAFIRPTCPPDVDMLQELARELGVPAYVDEERSAA